MCSQCCEHTGFQVITGTKDGTRWKHLEIKAAERQKYRDGVSDGDFDQDAYYDGRHLDGPWL